MPPIKQLLLPNSTITMIMLILGTMPSSTKITLIAILGFFQFDKQNEITQPPTWFYQWWNAFGAQEIILPPRFF
jgi:hypothetical protein